MTEAELSQYRAIKLEIADLEARIKNLEHQKDGLIFDKVTGSMKDFPYTERRFTITGADPDEYKLRMRRIGELQRKRNLKLAELVQQESEMHDYIYSIPDSMTRQIFIMRFIDGLTQENIGQRLHIDRSVISRRINNYILKF